MPAVMAHYGAQNPLAGERFWNGISTGYAIHTDPVEAMVRGICEIIERDMVALTWSQMLRLPKLRLENQPEQLDYLLKWSSDHFIETYLFDATSDLNVPAVYCLQRAPHDVRAQNVVGAAVERTLSEAAFKALLEAIMVRTLCYGDGAKVKDPKATGFGNVEDGIRYMGVPERSFAFDFLIDDLAHRRTSSDAHSTPLPEDPAEALRLLVDRFTAKKMEVVVVDSTPRELRRNGLSAVSAVIPGLQPMSLVPSAQYFGHPRLYEGPRAMGYESRSEEDLNPWPQPFA